MFFRKLLEKNFGDFLKILSLLLLLAVNSSGENTTDRAEDTLRFINNAQNKLKLSSESKIIFLIGNTGSGKSTLSHYVAGDYSKLLSIEPTEGDEMYYAIQDGLDPDVDTASSTTVSRTLVPEIMIDESEFVWCDCPGFGDTRNTTVEIATTFLIKSVIDNALNAKIVLVVNHGAVVGGYDRSDLERLITHTTELVKNVERYKESVSMVVTKVDPYRMIGRKPIDVTEQDVKKSVAKYLSDYRKVLIEKGSPLAKIQLVDALLKQTPRAGFARIGVFWRPVDAGPFNTIEKMVKGRKLIRDTVLRETIYTEIQRDDFGYALTDTAQLRIGEMAQYVIDNMRGIFSDIDRETLELLQEKIIRVHDFFEREEILENIDRQIVNLWKTGAIHSISTLTARIAALTDAFNLTLGSDGLRQVLRHEENLNILKSIARFEINAPIDDYVSKIFASTFDYIRLEHNWSKFLVNVYDFLVGYEVQKDVTLYNVRELKDWKIRYKPQGLYINEENLKEFVNQLKFYIELNIDGMAHHLNEINEIIKFALQTPPSIKCNDDTLTIRGNFLKSSNIQKVKDLSNVSKIKVFVAGTFFVDSNLRLSQHLEILAHKWEILNEFTFYLNGENGEAIRPPGNLGTPGRPGNIGSNGKNFFGLADEIVSGDLLTVNVNGGDGGAGQAGSGNLDQRVELFRSKHKGWIGIADDVSTFYRNYLSDMQQYKVNRTFKSKSEFRYFALLWGGTYKTNYYRVFPHQCCGNIGRGGSGGIGGFAGKYRFITLKGAAKSPKFVAMNGKSGAHGNDAASCDDSGVLVRVDTKDDIIAIFGIMLDSTFEVEDRLQNDDCPDKFIVSSIAAPTPNSVKPLKPTKSIIEYKILLQRKILDLPSLKKPFGNSCDAIDSNVEVNKIFTIKDLAVEINALGKQSELFDKLPSYVNLLSRIQEYCSNLNHANCTDSERQVRDLLYAHTLNQIDLRNNKKTNLTIDHENDFEGIMNITNHLLVISGYPTNIEVAIDAILRSGDAGLGSGDAGSESGDADWGSGSGSGDADWGIGDAGSGNDEILFK